MTEAGYGEAEPSPHSGRQSRIAVVQLFGDHYTTESQSSRRMHREKLRTHLLSRGDTGLHASAILFDELAQRSVWVDEWLEL